MLAIPLYKITPTHVLEGCDSSNISFHTSLEVTCEANSAHGRARSIMHLCRTFCFWRGSEEPPTGEMPATTNHSVSQQYEALVFFCFNRQSRHLTKFRGYLSQWVNQSGYSNTTIQRISLYLPSYSSVGPCLTCDGVNSGALSMSYGFVSHLFVILKCSNCNKNRQIQVL